MVTRRDLLAAPALPLAAAGAGGMELAMHQTTTAGAGFRRSLESYARAGIRLVEVIPPLVQEFVAQEGIAPARRFIADLGLKAISSGGVRGLAEPHAGRPQALEELKARTELVAALGIDRMVCPCNTTARFTPGDYQLGADNLREAGEIAKRAGVTLMLEFMRGSTFAGTLPTALRLTRQAAHPNVKPMFDFYHFWAGLSKFEDLDLVRPGELHHVHFQDVPDMPRELLDNTTREVPGEGIAPLVRILEKLKAKGYRGPLSVELFLPGMQQGDPYEAAMRIRQSAAPVLRAAGVGR